ncbi:MAG: hypothetical protein N3H31_04795 [Candidatus Nezhaarchaeota archaeon]|nr:hypothetical protein [Candidatus Nezhaarchaeota archaeon]
MGRIRHVLSELTYHAPFTALGVVLGITLVWLLSPHIHAEAHQEVLHEKYFHVLHSAHLLLSALTTAAVYHRHGAGYAKAFAIGMAGSVPICSTSDILIPFLGGRLLGIEGLGLHACIIEHPEIPIVSAIVGSVIGIGLSIKLKEPDLVPHGGHVMISVLASLLYLMSFSALSFNTLVTTYLLHVFAVVFLAVLVPCCTSDVVIPTVATASHLEVGDADRYGWLWRIRKRVGLK